MFLLYFFVAEQNSIARLSVSVHTVHYISKLSVACFNFFFSSGRLRVPPDPHMTTVGCLLCGSSASTGVATCSTSPPPLSYPLHQLPLSSNIYSPLLASPCVSLPLYHFISHFLLSTVPIPSSIPASPLPPYTTLFLTSGIYFTTLFPTPSTHPPST